jgi:nitrilase
MNSQDDKSANLKIAAALINKAVAQEQPDLVVLPEYYAFLGDSPEAMHDSAETFPNGESYRLMSGLAEKHGITIHAGSVAGARRRRLL